MVDIEETGLITLDEIILMIEECSNIASDVYTGQSQELEEVIQKLGIHILDKGISVFAIVQKLGIASAGMDGTRFIPMKDQVWQHCAPSPCCCRATFLAELAIPATRRSICCSLRPSLGARTT